MALDPQDIKDIALLVVQMLQGAGAEPPKPSRFVLGFSTDTNEHGAVECELVNQWLAGLPPKEQVRYINEGHPIRFGVPVAVKASRYASKDAELTLRQNLGNRNWLIFGQRMLEMKAYKWVRTPKTGVDIPWDDSDYLQMVPLDGWIPNHVAWGWDDKHVDAEFVLKYCQSRFKGSA